MQKKFMVETRKTGKEWLEHYTKLMEIADCEDFIVIKSSFEKYCNDFREKFAHIDKMIEYTTNMLVSSLEFSFELGLKDNLKHFKNPKLPTFLDEDYDTAMREKELKKKIDYAEAYNNLDEIIRLIPQNEYKFRDVCFEYLAYMETFIPKIAHYCGFVYGNKIHKKMYDGYEPDYELTNKYREWVNCYFGMNLE